MTAEDSRVDQTHLSAEQSRAKAPARLPFADGDQKRPKGAVAPPGQGPQAPVGVNPTSRPLRLKKRAEFLAARKGVRAGRPLVTVEARKRDDPGAARVGFTATKRIGGAVVRNRAKRRLRAAVDQLVPTLAQPGCDYVFIARQGTSQAPWPSLLDDVRKALLRLRPALGGPDSGDQPPPPAAPDQNGPE
jgi:ribonuclease P protein component